VDRPEIEISAVHRWLSRTRTAEGAEGAELLSYRGLSQDLRTSRHRYVAVEAILRGDKSKTPEIHRGEPFALSYSVDSNCRVNDLTEIIIACAIELHRKYGPGLLHSVYLLLLAQKLLERNLTVEVEKPIPLVDGTVHIDKAFRADLVVNEQVVVEVKAIKNITDIDVAQLLTYLRLMDKRVGLIINFNVSVLKHGIRRVVNRYVNDEGQLL
jgi:GxxExxY protein